jgi:hypothetical protein
MRGIEGYRGVLAGGYAPMPLIPMGIADRRKDAHTLNTLGHPMSAGTSIEQGPALRATLPALCCGAAWSASGASECGSSVC